MKALGSYFQKKREEQGYSVQEVARRTNMSSRYVEAIENQEFNEFPADVYAKGFIRNYAKFLDLDDEALVMEYTLNFEEGESDNDTESKRSRFLYWSTIAGLVLLTVLIVLFRFAWVHPGNYSQTGQNSQRAVNSIETHKATKSTLSVGDDVDRIKLRVVASEKALIYAEFDGMEKREFVMLPGEQATWTAEEVIRVRTGDPGGLSFYFKGMSLPPLGPPGTSVDKVIHLNDGTLSIRSVELGKGNGSDVEGNP